MSMHTCSLRLATASLLLLLLLPFGFIGRIIRDDDVNDDDDDY